jgi:hypothetical protein
MIRDSTLGSRLKAGRLSDVVRAMYLREALSKTRTYAIRRSVGNATNKKQCIHSLVRVMLPDWAKPASSDSKQLLDSNSKRRPLEGVIGDCTRICVQANGELLQLTEAVFDMPVLAKTISGIQFPGVLAPTGKSCSQPSVPTSAKSGMRRFSTQSPTRIPRRLDPASGSSVRMAWLRGGARCPNARAGDHVPAPT